MLCQDKMAINTCRVFERMSCVRVYVVHSCICLAFVCMYVYTKQSWSTGVSMRSFIIIRINGCMAADIHAHTHARTHACMWLSKWSVERVFMRLWVRVPLGGQNFQIITFIMHENMGTRLFSAYNELARDANIPNALQNHVMMLDCSKTLELNIVLDWWRNIFKGRKILLIPYVEMYAHTDEGFARLGILLLHAADVDLPCRKPYIYWLTKLSHRKFSIIFHRHLLGYSIRWNNTNLSREVRSHKNTLTFDV